MYPCMAGSDHAILVGQSFGPTVRPAACPAAMTDTIRLRALWEDLDRQEREVRRRRRLARLLLRWTPPPPPPPTPPPSTTTATPTMVAPRTPPPHNRRRHHHRHRSSPLASPLATPQLKLEQKHLSDIWLKVCDKHKDNDKARAKYELCHQCHQQQAWLLSLAKKKAPAHWPTHSPTRPTNQPPRRQARQGVPGSGHQLRSRGDADSLECRRPGTAGLPTAAASDCHHRHRITTATVSPPPPPPLPPSPPPPCHHRHRPRPRPTQIFETSAGVLCKDRFSILAALCRKDGEGRMDPPIPADHGTASSGAFFLDRDWCAQPLARRSAC